MEESQDYRACPAMVQGSGQSDGGSGQAGMGEVEGRLSDPRM